jgi:hypothetical protein
MAGSTKHDGLAMAGWLTVTVALTGSQFAVGCCGIRAVIS